MRAVILCTALSQDRLTHEYINFVGGNCTHEDIRGDIVIGWQYAVREAFQRKYPPIPDLSGLTVLHQVRNPIDVICAAATHSVGMWEFIGHYCPISNRFDLLDRALYWVHWNELCRLNAMHSFQVEKFLEGGPVTERVLSTLGLPYRGKPDLDFTETRKYNRLSKEAVRSSLPCWAWDLLLAEASLYGYEL